MTDAELKRKIRAAYRHECVQCGETEGSLYLEREWGWLCETCRYAQKGVLTGEAEA